jgi:hypothetical protein
MKKKLPVIFPVVLLSLLSAKLFAQTAAFTSSVHRGCAPFTISFTDMSIAATSWSWDFGNSTSSLLQNPPPVLYLNQGTYIVTLTINGGASTASDTIVVDSIPMQPDTIFGTPYSCVGAGGVGMYYAYPASGSASYIWTVPAGTVIIGSPAGSSIRVLWGATAGNISATATNDCGTSATAHVNSAVVGLDTSITTNASTLISNAIFCTYQWIECPAMTILAGDTNKTFTPSANGSYAVIITSEGCADTSSCRNIISTGVFSPEMTEERVIIYPNPTSNTFTIKNISSNEPLSLQIINLVGEIVYTEKLSGKKEYLVDANFAKGIYFVRVKDITRKLVVE